MASDFKKLSDKVKPREQLRDAVSPSELKPEALLAILLRTGSAGCNVLETARRLVDAFGSVAELVKSDWRTLDRHIREYNELHPERKIKGVGQLKMLELAAAFELVRRGYEIDGEDIRRIKIAKPEDSYRIFREAALVGEEQESFFVLPLDTKNHPLCTAPFARDVRVAGSNACSSARSLQGRDTMGRAVNHRCAQPSVWRSDAWEGRHPAHGKARRGFADNRYPAAGSFDSRLAVKRGRKRFRVITEKRCHLSS